MKSSMHWSIVVIVLIGHYLLSSIPLFESKTQQADSRAYSLVPVEIAPLAPDDKRSIVRAERYDDSSEQDARFLSENRNRVKKETQAARRGRFSTGKSSKPELPAGEGEFSPGIADLMPFGSSPNGLPEDVEQGESTLLNTDSYQFASFLHRVAEEIYDTWVRYAQDAVEDMGRKGKLEERTYITRILVILDRDGEVSSVHLVEKSGNDALDAAPGKAFWRAEKFPNPPEQMVGVDGFARLPYEFQFQLRSGFFNIVPMRI